MNHYLQEKILTLIRDVTEISSSCLCTVSLCQYSRCHIIRYYVSLMNWHKCKVKHESYMAVIAIFLCFRNFWLTWQHLLAQKYIICSTFYPTTNPNTRAPNRLSHTILPLCTAFSIGLRIMVQTFHTDRIILLQQPLFYTCSVTKPFSTSNCYIRQ